MMRSISKSELVERLDRLEKQIDDIKEQLSVRIERLDVRNTNRRSDITTRRYSDANYDKQRDESIFRYRETLRRHNCQMTVLTSIVGAIWIVAIISSFV